MVLFRTAYPKSKLKTSEYLNRFLKINWNEDKILVLNLKTGDSAITEKDSNLHLIISYSDKRAKKEKTIEKEV